MFSKKLKALSPMQCVINTPKTLEKDVKFKSRKEKKEKKKNSLCLGTGI